MSDKHDSPAVLTIDLNAIVRNYKRLQHMSAPAECGAVMKSDAYSLGIIPIGRALAQSGCKTFFVGHVDEGIKLRMALPDVRIIVMHGLSAESVAACYQANLVPVLNSMTEIEIWSHFIRACDQGKRPAIIHLDTGMNRLGLGADELPFLYDNLQILEPLDLHAWMTHLACAPQADHPMNREQREKLLSYLKPLPKAPITMSATMGLFLGDEFLFDLTRPGGGLYGIYPRHLRENPPFEPVITLEARVLQVRDVKKGDVVGYGSTYRFDRDSRVATLAMGYYDGYLRSLSNQGYVYVKDYRAPIVGIVSMDLVTVDVTDIPPELVYKGGMMEMMGMNHTCVDVAIEAGSHAHQVLTNLSPRYERRYIELDAPMSVGEVA